MSGNIQTPGGFPQQVAIAFGAEGGPATGVDAENPLPFGAGDGEIETLGAKADSAYSGSGSASLISIAKGLYAKLVTALTVQKGQQTVTAVTIANGTALSPAVDLGVGRLVGIETPVGLTQATMSFQASVDGVTWKNVYTDGGIEKTITLGPDRRIILSPPDWYNVRWLKVRFGTWGSPSNANADREIVLVTEA